MPLDATGMTPTYADGGETGTGDTGEQFYDSQAAPIDPVDDGTQDDEPTGTVGGAHMEGDDDPSAGNALSGTKAGMTEGQQAAASELRNFLERIERLAEEAKIIREDIKDVLGEAKGRGYDTKAIRTLLKLRSTDANQLREQLSILRTYAHALGIDEELV